MAPTMTACKAAPQCSRAHLRSDPIAECPAIALYGPQAGVPVRTWPGGHLSTDKARNRFKREVLGKYYLEHTNKYLRVIPRLLSPSERGSSDARDDRGRPQ